MRMTLGQLLHGSFLFCAAVTIKVCQQQLRQHGGINLLIKVLLKYVENRRVQAGRKAGVKIAHQHEGDDSANDDGIGGSVSILVVAIIDCLQKSIVGNKKNEAIFAQQEGVDMTLKSSGGVSILAKSAGPAYFS